MVCLHGYPATAVADVLHGSELIFAYMLRIDLRSAAETAFLGIATRVAEVTGLIGHRPTGFTRIGHGISPLCQGNRHASMCPSKTASFIRKYEARNVKSGQTNPSCRLLINL